MSKIGIDALHLSCLTVRSIDWKALEKNDRVDLHHGRDDLRVIWDSIAYNQPDCNYVDRIIIKDDEKFYRCTIGILRPMYSRPILYCKLQLTVHHARGSNIFSMSWNEYDDYIRHIISGYIPQHYGVAIDMAQATVSYMELNCDIDLTQQYNKYGRVLKLLMSGLNKRFNDLKLYERAGKVAIYDSLLRENKSLSVLMYNKQHEIRKNNTPQDERILRIEFALKSANKVARLFKTRKWSYLTDNMICICCHKLFQDLIVLPFIRWKNDTHNMLIRKLKRMIEKNNWPRKWAQILMDEIRDSDLHSTKPLLLDVEQVYDAIKCLPDPSRNNGKKISILQRNECRIIENTYLNQDLLKVREIFEKEYQAYKNHLPE